LVCWRCLLLTDILGVRAPAGRAEFLPRGPLLGGKTASPGRFAVRAPACALLAGHTPPTPAGTSDDYTWVAAWPTTAGPASAAPHPATGHLRAPNAQTLGRTPSTNWSLLCLAGTRSTMYAALASRAPACHCAASTTAAPSARPRQHYRPPRASQGITSTQQQPGTTARLPAIFLWDSNGRSPRVICRRRCYAYRFHKTDTAAWHNIIRTTT